MKNPESVTSMSVATPNLTKDKAIRLSEQLLTITGVKEARWVEDDQATYLKVDKKQYDEKAVNELLSALRTESEMASRGVNKVILIGNLVQIPKCVMQNNTAMAIYRLRPVKPGRTSKPESHASKPN